MLGQSVMWAVKEFTKRRKCKVFIHSPRKVRDMTPRQDGGIGRHTVPPHTTKRRTTTNLKIEKQPELTENQTVCKSDNQGDKEETLTRTGRRGGEDTQQGGGLRTGRPHIHVQINWEEQLGSEIDHTTQGSSARK